MSNLTSLLENTTTSELGTTKHYRATLIGCFTPKEMLEKANNGMGNHFINGQHYASIPSSKRIYVWEQSYRHQYPCSFPQGIGYYQSFKRTATEAELIGFNFPN